MLTVALAQLDPHAAGAVGTHRQRGHAAVFLLVFLSTFPVVIPFIFMKDAWVALRVSNLIAIAMLFLTGWAFGRITGRPPWIMGVSMVVLGAILVGLTMALGG